MIKMWERAWCVEEHDDENIDADLDADLDGLGCIGNGVL